MEVDGRGEVVHNGISLVIDGTVNMQLSAKSVGLFEAFYNSVKPIPLISSTVEVMKPGKLPRFVITNKLKVVLYFTHLGTLKYYSLCKIESMEI